MTIKLFLLVVTIFFCLTCIKTQIAEFESKAIYAWWIRLGIASAMSADYSVYPKWFLHIDFETGISVYRYEVYHTKLLKQPPFITPPNYAPDNKGWFYCVMALDWGAGPDALSPRTLAPMILWLHINMRGVVPTSGETVIEYMPPMSMPHMDFSLITYSVFVQNDFIRWKRKKIKRKDKPINRVKFQVKEFIQRHKLSLHYGGFFRISFDSGCYEEYKARGHPCDIECTRNYTSDEGMYYGRGDNIYKAILPLYSRDMKSQKTRADASPP